MVLIKMPHVDVVDLLDAVAFVHGPHHFFEVHIIGNPVHQDMNRLLYQGVGLV